MVKPNTTHVRGLPVVPENILRKRKTTAEIKAGREDRLAREKANKPKKTGKLFKKASAFIKEYRQSDRSERRFNREAKKTTSSEDLEGRLVLAVRVKGMNTADPKTKRVLKTLRLHQNNTAAFVKGNAGTAKMLRLVAPYVVYGVPELKTVRDLVLKRGFTAKGNRHQPLSSNQLIEEHLGAKGLVCLEDLINELYNVGPNFNDANHFLVPFKMQPPKQEDKPEGITNRPKDGGPSDRINDLVGIMN